MPAIDGDRVHETAPSLGEVLRKIRESRGFSLRAVEKLTNISNAYLSQLETGKIEKPSPNYLYSLSQAYDIPYETLMEAAGYVARHPEGRRAQSLLGAALATMEDLTPEEEAELMNYIAFLRSKRARDSHRPQP